MELGLQIPSFTWPGGPSAIAPTLARTARAAEDAGFAHLSVMDHVWQIPQVGPVENEMLEAYTTLGFIAAQTSTITLYTLVTGVTYREPALLAKMVTTLDVLSEGRAMLGIGAAWNAEESAGLGLSLPPLAARFERLEEALQIILQMWDGDETPYAGKHYQLDRLLSSPQPLSAPRPRIMIGGGGEKKTLRLVAQYGDACNLVAGPELAHKLDVLKGHCADLGRDYDTILKTAFAPTPLAADGSGADELLAQLREISDLGVTMGIVSIPAPDGPDAVAKYGELIIPEISGW